MRVQEFVHGMAIRQADETGAKDHRARSPRGGREARTSSGRVGRPSDSPPGGRAVGDPGSEAGRSRLMSGPIERPGNGLRDLLMEDSPIKRIYLYEKDI